MCLSFCGASRRFGFCKVSPHLFCCCLASRCSLWAALEGWRFRPDALDAFEIPNFGEFFRFFVPSLTGVVGFWATVSLNIPDFTRYARSQRDQILGQALGLPATMTFYSFIGIAVTSATLIIFGQALWDPVEVLSRLGQSVRRGPGDACAADGHAQRQRRRKRGFSRRTISRIFLRGASVFAQAV